MGAGMTRDGDRREPAIDIPVPRRSRLALVSAVSLAVVVVLLVWLLGTRPEAATRITHTPLLDRAAPTIAGKTIDGKQFDLASEQGKWVLVNFFATWCAPCRAEHPELVSFHRRHAQAGDAMVVSVVYGDDPDEVGAFFDKNGGAWPVVAENTDRVALDYGVAGVPESFLVDPQGTVRAKITGGVTSLKLDRLLASLQ